MGIDANIAFLTSRAAEKWRLTGDVCSLGVVTHYSSQASLTAAIRAGGRDPVPSDDPFLAMGFSSVASVDVSDFEGCSHVFDLNSPATPSALTGRFDFIFNQGTLEHVFDVPAALRNVFRMLRDGGVVVHSAPINGWVDHGFYQLSPTLFLDYYRANHFDVLESYLIEYAPTHESVVVHPYTSGCLDHVQAGSLPGVWLYYGIFRKTGRSRADGVPLQHLYARQHGKTLDTGVSGPKLFAPFRIVDGQPCELPLTRYPLSRIRAGEGLEWQAPLPDLAHLADSLNGQGSPLLLLEDGVLIGPGHALHQDIRDLGGGRYSHWERMIYFSTSDNQPPGDRVYEAAIPETPVP